MVMDLKDKIAAINKKNEEDIKNNSKKRKTVEKKIKTMEFNPTQDAVPTLEFVTTETDNCVDKNLFERDLLDMLEVSAKVVLYIALSVLAVKIALVGF